MDTLAQNRFSAPATVFPERRLPVSATLAGYSALIGAYDLQVPLPRRLSAIGERHRFLEQDGWRIYLPRYKPDESLEGHLTFALKYEGLDLAVLKRLFAATGPNPLVDMVKARPTGTYSRRVWFLYEWLTGSKLDLPNADRGVYPLIVDPNQQFAIPAQKSPRHRGQEQSSRHAGFLSASIPHRSTEAFYRLGPTGPRSAGYCRRAALSTRAHGHLSACQGFKVEFRN